MRDIRIIDAAFSEKTKVDITLSFKSEISLLLKMHRDL